MVFADKVQVPGDSDTYQISSQIKKYTLRDLGFDLKPNGTFIYEGSLDPTSPFEAVAKLKITFKKDLGSFKMDTVNKSGSATVNIFKHARADEFTTQYHFILDEMVKRGVFEKV